LIRGVFLAGPAVLERTPAEVAAALRVQAPK
jgi:hypothetical protein